MAKEVIPITDMKLLTVADHGLGKTQLLGTIAPDPRFMPALMIDFEGGTKSILSKVLPLQIGEGRGSLPDLDGLFKGDYIEALPLDKIHVIRPRTWQQLNDLVDFCNDPKDKANIYKTNIFDSLTEVNYLNLGYVTSRSVKADSRRVVKEKELGGELMPEQSDYGTSAVQMRKLCRLFRDWPVHVLMTALMVLEKDELAGTVEYFPNFTGKLAREIPALFDYIGIIRQDREGKRKIQWQPDGKYKAKARDEHNVLGFETTNLSLPYILDLLEGRR